MNIHFISDSIYKIHYANILKVGNFIQKRKKKLLKNENFSEYPIILRQDLNEKCNSSYTKNINKPPFSVYSK